jgi:uncharacterized damage-inducible protein DinB
MKDRRTLFDEALDAWDDARTGLIAEVENIPPDRFDFRPAAEARSVSELILHIMEVGLMMVGELSREDTNLHRAPWPKLLALYSGPIDKISGKRQLLAALRNTHRDGVKAFRDAGELHMMQFIKRFDGENGTRLAWFHHGIAHEMYHRGQLAVYQRMMGVTPALTKLINPS